MRSSFRQVLITFVWLVSFLIVFSRPLLAVNYGEGNYGVGTYNVGEEPTPTPSPVASPSPTSTPAGSSQDGTNGSNGGSGSSPGSTSPAPPSCADLPPGAKLPWLYAAVPLSATSIQLYFTSAGDPVDHYAVEYGLQSGEYRWSNPQFGDGASRTYTVESLTPGTNYTFRVRGGNGCAPGGWSNEISTSTLGRWSQSSLRTTNLELAGRSAPTSPPKEICQPYVVQSGDSLWSIAANELGDGSLFTQIRERNQSKYPGLAASDSLTAGWELDLICQEQDNSADREQAEDQASPQAVMSYVLEVKVVNPAEQPVAGAKVTLHSTPRETVTDAQGVARFEEVEAGPHRLIIAYDSYQGEQNLELSGDQAEYTLTVTVVQQKSWNWLYAGLGLVIGGAGALGLVWWRRKRKP